MILYITMYTCLQKRARKSVSHYGEPINSNEITTTPKSVSSLSLPYLAVYISIIQFIVVE